MYLIVQFKSAILKGIHVIEYKRAFEQQDLIWGVYADVRGFRGTAVCQKAGGRMRVYEGWPKAPGSKP